LVKLVTSLDCSLVTNLLEVVNRSTVSVEFRLIAKDWQYVRRCTEVRKNVTTEVVGIFVSPGKSKSRGANSSELLYPHIVIEDDWLAHVNRCKADVALPRARQENFSDLTNAWQWSEIEILRIGRR